MSKKLLETLKDSPIEFKSLNESGLILDNDFHFCLLTCKEDYDDVLKNLQEKSNCNKLTTSNATCQIVLIDGEDADFIAACIYLAEVVVIALSLNFSRINFAFQAIIYTVRTLRKPYRYYNIHGKYEELVNEKNDNYFQKSHLSLLVGDEFIHSSWEIIWEGWICCYKKVNVENQNNFKKDCTLNDSLFYMKNIKIISIYSKNNEMVVKRITDTLNDFSVIDIFNISQIGEVLGNTESFNLKTIGCALIFVSVSFSKDKDLMELLEYIQTNQIPIVVIVSEGTVSWDNSWSKTGLGLLLANELWIDFTTKSFYIPGEVIPSFESKILNLIARVKSHLKRFQNKNDNNINYNTGENKSDSNNSDYIPQVYISHCHADSKVAKFDEIVWPLPHYDNDTYEKDHDTMRYASKLFHKGIKIELDVELILRPESFFELLSTASNTANIHLLFWSVKYMQSFYCICDTKFAMLTSDKIVVIVMLDDEYLIREACKTIPDCEKLLSKLSQTRITTNSNYYYGFNLFVIPSHNKSFEEVSSVLIDILKNHTHHSINAPLYSCKKDKVNRISRNISDIIGSNSYDILISYCWRNSKLSYESGEVNSFVGYSDPRFMKTAIEAVTGLRCWLDIERLGVEGLYQGIHEAAKSVKCIVLFVSDDYCNSPNCKMELEYAMRKKNDKYVIASVGTGYNWKYSVSGYYAGYQKIHDFIINKFPDSLEGREKFEYLVDNIKQIVNSK